MFVSDCSLVTLTHSIARSRDSLTTVQDIRTKIGAICLKTLFECAT